MGSTKTAHKPKPAELSPVPWDKIEPHFKAGLRSIKSIAEEFGVSRRAIDKHAVKMRWARSLKPQIMARAEELVALQAQLPVAHSVAPPTPSEAQTIEVNAQALAIVQHAHRSVAGQARGIGTSLLIELGATTHTPELFAKVIDLLEHVDTPDDDGKANMRALVTLVSSLPQRAGVFKTMVEAMSKVQGMEREAFGLNAEDGTGTDRFTVIIKDYTGRGDPDSPRAREAAGEA